MSNQFRRGERARLRGVCRNVETFILVAVLYSSVGYDAGASIFSLSDFTLGAVHF